MRSMGRLSIVLLLLAASAATAGALEPTPAKPRSHGNSISGTIARIDGHAGTFVVRTTTGSETTLVRTRATHVPTEGLRTGDRVAVRWLEKDGKKIATSVRVETPAVASATATVTPTASTGTR